MPNSYFKFKQFIIHQDQCAMKVGTDGVLLGAWCHLEKVKRILDIGTGTGLIALMLAQRCEALIDAIDIDKDACSQAKENVRESLFAKRIHVENNSLEDYTQQQHEPYDLIVSNPPYFINSLKCPDKQRNTARHSDTLSMSELLHSSTRLMQEGSRLALILPFDQRDQLLQQAQIAKLCPLRETIVYPTPTSSPKRLLIEFTNLFTTDTLHSKLIIETARHQYTDEYIQLTKDFYLKM